MTNNGGTWQQSISGLTSGNIITYHFTYEKAGIAVDTGSFTYTFTGGGATVVPTKTNTPNGPTLTPSKTPTFVPTTPNPTAGPTSTPGSPACNWRYGDKFPDLLCQQYTRHMDK